MTHSSSSTPKVGLEDVPPRSEGTSGELVVDLGRALGMVLPRDLCNIPARVEGARLEVPGPELFRLKGV
jgi:hypothetical protein